MNESLCFGCRDWNHCQHIFWFNPGEIVYCRVQIMWGISVLDVLAEGWPPNPDGSSYIDPSVWTQPKRNAPFVIPADFKAEIERRLKWTGEDGEDLKLMIQEGVEYDKLTRRAKHALNYISGKPKATEYPRWKANTTHRTKVQLEIRANKKARRKRHTGR